MRDWNRRVERVVLGRRAVTPNQHLAVAARSFGDLGSLRVILHRCQICAVPRRIADDFPILCDEGDPHADQCAEPIRFIVELGHRYGAPLPEQFGSHAGLGGKCVLDALDGQLLQAGVEENGGGDRRDGANGEGGEKELGSVR